MVLRPHLALLSVVLLLALNAAVWMAVFAPARLSVSLLDIGQGDSILIQSPTGRQMLIDSGPDRSVLRQLPSVMGPIDRSLDLLVETHPDADHIGGFPGVFNRYAVRAFMNPGITNDTNQTKALMASAATEPKLQYIEARRGMRIHLGGGAYADVLYPDRNVSGVETNDGSVVLHLVYGATSFMLTGDLPSTVEDWLVRLDSRDGELESDVLKAGHHGSKYSSDDAWLAAVHPSVAAISAGKDNRYGHPSVDALARIAHEGARVVSTIEKGTITFVSDGTSIWEKYQK